MYRSVRVILAVLLVCLAANLMPGVSLAQPPVSDVTVNYMEATRAETEQTVVSAYVSVLTKDGHPISGLTEDSFTVIED